MYAAEYRLDIRLKRRLKVDSGHSRGVVVNVVTVVLAAERVGAVGFATVEDATPKSKAGKRPA
jgi:hypothetical protein